VGRGESQVIRYFAYGSNLSSGQMIARMGPFPDAFGPPRMARLAGYRLAFNMRGETGQIYANIVQPGEEVIGVVYECAEDALKTMDRYEFGYHRERVEVVSDGGDVIEAVTYVAEPGHVVEGGRPSEEYLQRILRGGREHGLPESYLCRIAALLPWAHILGGADAD
jgi:gamma-glutamylcyclotransferase